MAVRAVGSVSCSSTLAAPFTARECVFYRVVLREWDNGDLVDLLATISSTPLYVCTGKAKLVFDPVHSDAHVRARVANGDSLNCPNEFAAFFDNHALDIPLWESGMRRSFRWEESILLSGDQVHVAGTVTTAIDSTGRSTYREPPSLPAIGHPGAVLIDDS